MIIIKITMKLLRHNDKIKNLYRSILGSPFNWSPTVKSRKRLGSAFVRMLFLIRGRVTQGYVGVCYVFATECRSIVRHQGEGGLATHLKVCYVLLQKELGGDHLVDTTVLKARVARTRKGLPRIIPVVHRNEIRGGNQYVIQLWITLFGLYRVLDAKRKIKMWTISSPFSGDNLTIPSLVSFIPTFLWKLRQCHGGRDIGFQSWDWRIKPIIITKTSPTSRPSVVPTLRGGGTKFPATKGDISSTDLKRDLGVWKHHPALFKKLCEWFSLIGATRLLVTLTRDFPKVRKARYSEIGKFGFKEEPGKIRVFAMVDYLTQVALKPLHKVIFRVLRPLATDGTFDQGRPLNALFAKYPHREMWSFDLSAATDRLPLVVQRELLSEWLGEKLATLWASLLVDRDYYVTESAQFEYGIERSYYKYAVGQPMGAYSSWGMLALTHHLIVQYCASKVGRKANWFDAYCVLGDDVVIADQSVAEEYLRTMRGLGVGVGLEKSILQARSTCEFAKRFIFKGSNCSPLSFAAYGIAQSNISVLDMLVQSARAIRPELTLKAALRFAGAGYKVLGRLPAVLDTKGRFASLVLFMTRPGGSFARPLFEWVFGTWDGVLDHTGRDRSRVVDWLIKEELLRLAAKGVLPDRLKSKYCAYDNILVNDLPFEQAEKPLDPWGDNLTAVPKLGIQDWLRSGVHEQANALSMDIMDEVVRILIDWHHRENDPEGLLETLSELQLREGELQRLYMWKREKAKAPTQTRMLKQIWALRKRVSS